MYKMYNTQWDDETEDDKNSLSSSFWSDGEKPEEEEVEIERVKPVDDAEDSLQETSEEEKLELNNKENFTTESLEEESNNDVDKDKEEEEEEEEDCDDKSCSNSPDSPAPSLMTSGYGTYRPEEQEGGDYRDDHTITEFDQDSRCDLSEMRDDEEDDRSLGSFGEFDIESTREPDFSESPVCVLDDNLVANVVCCVEDGPHEEISVTNMKPEEWEELADVEKGEENLHPASDNKVTKATTEKPQNIETEDKFLLDEAHLEDDLNDGEKQEVVQDLHRLNSLERVVEDKVESEDPDESSSNKDIKFIDSKVNFSWRTYDKMCVEWEGNLRQMKDVASCLEEQLADLHLSTAAPQDTEAESEDRSDHSDSQSSEGDGISLSTFESYVRGMAHTQSDAAFRPKPKSFIRPVMSQQSIKKTDPVSKYFQYKQFWEMFKLPGEKDRRALRWEIKEQLAYQPPPPKPRRVYLPNTYVVPTEKKRSALRWEIRNDLANGLLPHKFSYRF